MESAELQVSIKTALEQERWIEVVELVSQTNWQNEALLPSEAVALSEALFRISGKEELASKYAELFIDFYGDIAEVKALKGVRGRYYKWLGDKYERDSDYDMALAWYGLAVNDLRYLPSIKLNTETAIKDIEQLIKKQEEREAKERRIAEQEEAELKAFLAQSLRDVGSLSTAVLNRLAAYEINTLGDLENTSLREIDAIPGIGDVAISEIRAYKTKHNLL